MIVLYPSGCFLYLNSEITESVEKVDHWFLSDHRIHWPMPVCWLHCQSLLVSYLLFVNKIISIVHKFRIHQTKLLINFDKLKRKGSDYIYKQHTLKLKPQKAPNASDDDEITQEWVALRPATLSWSPECSEGKRNVWDLLIAVQILRIGS